MTARRTRRPSPGPARDFRALAADRPQHPPTLPVFTVSNDAAARTPAT